MAEFPSLPLFTDAFIADTLHLDMEQTGAYITLLMVAWRMPACALPDDDKMLAKWTRMSLRAWRKLKPSVMAFWVLENGFFFQKRLKKEREYASRRAAVARENGRLGGRPNPIKQGTSNNPAGSSRDTQDKSKMKAPNPIPNPKEEQEREARARPRTREISYLGEDWELPAEWRSWAAKKSPRHAHMIDGDAERFKLHYTDDGRGDWERTWQKWWLRTIERAPRKAEPKAPSFKDPDWGGVKPHNTDEPWPVYKARMIAEGHYKE